MVTATKVLVNESIATKLTFFMVMADGEVDTLLQLVGISKCFKGVQGMTELYHGQLTGDA